jgi:D,D-heptose 1,7-bisphosphate phosphatase
MVVNRIKKGAKAVFLDRDGTINVDAHRLSDVTKLRLIPRAASAIKELNNLGYLAIIITNQAVIAKGMLTIQGLDEIHAVLIRRLGKQGAKIDAIYYCPHHPEGTVKEHSFVCKCRKPNPGMILKAVKKFNIDVRRSFMIGDTTGDILAGKRARLKTILVKTGYGGNDGKHNVVPDMVARNLKEAVKIIRAQPKWA